MKKTIYEVMKVSREISYKNRNEICVGCTTKNNNKLFIKPLNERFENKQDALDFLSKLESEVIFREGFVKPYYEVTEYFVEENVYNEWDEWLDGGDILAYSKMNFNLEEVEA